MSVSVPQCIPVCLDLEPTTDAQKLRCRRCGTQHPNRETEGGNPRIYVPQLCNDCQLLIVDQLRIGPDGPWQSTIVMVNIAAFQAATFEGRVWQRCGEAGDGKRKTEDLNLVLAEIGCLGCFLGKKFRKIVAHVAQHGLSDLAQITRDGDRMKAFVETL